MRRRRLSADAARPHHTASHRAAPTMRTLTEFPPDAPLSCLRFARASCALPPAARPRGALPAPREMPVQGTVIVGCPTRSSSKVPTILASGRAVLYHKSFLNPAFCRCPVPPDVKHQRRVPSHLQLREACPSNCPSRSGPLASTRVVPFSKDAVNALTPRRVPSCSRRRRML